MTGRMAKYWNIPRVGDKELPRVGHQLASCSLLISYVVMFLFIIFTVIFQGLSAWEAIVRFLPLKTLCFLSWSFPGWGKSTSSMHSRTTSGATLSCASVQDLTVTLWYRLRNAGLRGSTVPPASLSSGELVVLCVLVRLGLVLCLSWKFNVFFLLWRLS